MSGKSEIGVVNFRHVVTVEWKEWVRARVLYFGEHLGSAGASGRQIGLNLRKLSSDFGGLGRWGPAGGRPCGSVGIGGFAAGGWREESAIELDFRSRARGVAGCSGKPRGFCGGEGASFVTCSWPSSNERSRGGMVRPVARRRSSTSAQRRVTGAGGIWPQPVLHRRAMRPLKSFQAA